MLKFFFLLLFLISCSSPKVNYNKDNETIDFNKNMSFIEFRTLLKKYAKISQYPNIDK